MRGLGLCQSIHSLAQYGLASELFEVYIIFEGWMQRLRCEKHALPFLFILGGLVSFSIIESLVFTYFKSDFLRAAKMKRPELVSIIQLRHYSYR